MGENGIEEVDSTRIVEGDVILLREGRPIVADCILLRGEVVVDEGVLTGESIPIRK